MLPQIVTGCLEREVSNIKFCSHFYFYSSDAKGSAGEFLDLKANASAVESDAPGALASARAAPDKFSTNLTLSSAERRRFAARTGATIGVAREQELTRASMTAI